MAVSSQQVIEAARTWIGVPFRHQGRTRNGVDCIGLILAVSWELGLAKQSIDRPTYGRLPVDGSLEAEVAKYCTPLEDIKPACILLMRFDRSVTHVSLCTGETLIHSYESVGRVVEHGYRGKWVGRTVSAWALPGVAYE